MKSWEGLGFKSYQEYLNSSIWREKKDAMIGHHSLCELCQSINFLQVHHLNYNSVGNESESDLLVLCDECHKKVHNGQIKLKKECPVKRQNVREE